MFRRLVVLMFVLAFTLFMWMPPPALCCDMCNVTSVAEAVKSITSINFGVPLAHTNITQSVISTQHYLGNRQIHAFSPGLCIDDSGVMHIKNEIMQFTTSIYVIPGTIGHFDNRINTITTRGDNSYMLYTLQV